MADLPRAVADWLAATSMDSDDDGPRGGRAGYRPMPDDVAAAIDQIPERTPAQLDELREQDAALTASLADSVRQSDAELMDRLPDWRLT